MITFPSILSYYLLTLQHIAMLRRTALGASAPLVNLGARRLRTASTCTSTDRLTRHRARWRASSSGSDTYNIDTYNAWVADQQVRRNKAATSSNIGVTSITKPRIDTDSPPSFPHPSLFHPGAEEYASDMTPLPSDDFATIARETERAGLFAPYMVGAVEGQFLKMLAQIKGAKRVLDIGTFTGYSALAFAEGVVEGGSVVTIEADASAADVARNVFKQAKHGGKIELLEADARAEVADMARRGEKFDKCFWMGIRLTTGIITRMG